MSTSEHHFSMLELDCPDVVRIATFWSTVLAIRLDVAGEDYAQLSPPGSAPKWLFVRRGHPAGGPLTIALTSSDLGASTRLAVEAGASAHGVREHNGFRWSELTDPEGNRFTFNAPPPE